MVAFNLFLYQTVVAPQFQRLMGKRNIGRESINMVEIAADEQIGPTSHLDFMKKSLTEEKEYRAKLVRSTSFIVVFLFSSASVLH